MKETNRNLGCWIALALVIICAMVIRVRLASVPLERDEGEYAYMGQQLLQGVSPYASAYTLKLPGVHAVYAVIMAVFGQTHTGIHLGLLIANLTAIVLVFVLAKRLFNPVAGVTAGASFAIMSVSQSVLGIWANAEHFLIVPALVGILLIYGIAEKRRYGLVFAAGLMMGLAFLIKQHGIFFAVLGVVYLLYADLMNRPVAWKKLIFSQIAFAAGVIVPFGITCLLIWRAGVFDKFWFWTFTYAHKYVTVMPFYLGRELFIRQSANIVSDNILIWLLVLAGLLILFLRRQFRVKAFFVVGLVVFSFLSICPGFFFRGHYYILLLPAAAILAGAGFSGSMDLLVGRSAKYRRIIIMTLIGLAIAGYSLYSQRQYLFELSPVQVCRLVYDGNPFPESLEIAKYIKENSAPEAKIAIFGSEPQICFYADRRSATRYIYAYQLMDWNEYTFEIQEEMVREVATGEPEWVVLVNIQGSWILKPESVPVIFEWSNWFVEELYDTVGLIEIPKEGDTIYNWGGQAAGLSATTEHWIAVYKRKSGTSNLTQD